MRNAVYFLCVGVLALLGCSHSVPSLSLVRESERLEAERLFDLNKPLFGTIRRSERLTLYEGLPHQRWEAELLEEEMKVKHTFELRGYSFYQEPLELLDSDGRRLADLVGELSSFQSFSGSKKCGGFHPDYCLMWYIDGAICHCLICFGCHEVKLYVADSELYCDIQNGAYEQFKSLLKPYRKQRPANELTLEY